MPGIETNSINKKLNIITDFKQEKDWSVDLSLYILKIIPICKSEFIWVVCSEENVFLLNVKKGNIINRFQNIAEIIFSAIIHPLNDGLFISTSRGIFLLTINGEQITLINEHSWFEHIAVSADGNFIFSSHSKNLYILEKKAHEFELIEKDSSFHSTISDIIFNTNSFLVSSYGEVREYDVKTIHKPSCYEWKTSLLNTIWSPNKKYLAASTQENSIHFWPYQNEEKKDFQIGGYPSKVTKIIWSSDSTKLAVNCLYDVHIWDFSSGPPIGKMPIVLECGVGKIIDILYIDNFLVAASKEGLIFFFVPNNSDKPLIVYSVDKEISCISIDNIENKLYVGSTTGQLYCFGV